MNISHFVKNNRKLIIVFLAYCALLFVFGAIYEAEYSQNPIAFAFNSDILKAQKESLKTTTEAEANASKVKLEALRQLSDKLKANETIKLTYPVTHINRVGVGTPPQAEFSTSDFRLVFHGDVILYANPVAV